MILAVFSYLGLLAAVFVQVRRRWMTGIFLALYLLLAVVALDYVLLTEARIADFIVGRTYFSGMPMNGLEDYAAETRLVFATFSLAAVVCGIGYPRLAGRRSEGAALKRTLKYIQQKSLTNYSFIFAAGFLVLILLDVWHFTVIDKSVLYYNHEYLAIKNPESIGLEGELLLSIYHEVFRVFAILSVLSLCIFSWRDHPEVMLLSLTHLLYAGIILLAGSSRWIPLYGCMAIIALYGVGKLNLWKLVPLTIFTILSFQYALLSRSMNEFGLSRIIPNIESMDSEFVFKSLTGIFVNTFEGALNFANSLKIDPKLPDTYQLLSLSPLPSAIDGFNTDESVRITFYAPMGGLGEVYHFHWYYQLIFVICMIAFFRLTYFLDRYGSPLNRYGVGLISIYLLYLLPTYGLKTTWKGFLIITLILLAVRAAATPQRPRLRSRRFSANRIRLRAISPKANPEGTPAA